MPQESGSIGLDYTVRETVELYSAPYPSPLAVDEVVELVGLESAVNARTRTLSGGQRRRLDLAVAVAGNPELLFLDEPTTGFDPRPAGARGSSSTTSARSARPSCSTHYMDEAQNLAGRVAVIARGRIVAEGPPALLGGRDDGVALIRFRLPTGVDPAALPLRRYRGRRSTTGSSACGPRRRAS